MKSLFLKIFSFFKIFIGIEEVEIERDEEIEKKLKCLNALDTNIIYIENMRENINLDQESIRSIWYLIAKAFEEYSGKKVTTIEDMAICLLDIFEDGIAVEEDISKYWKAVKEINALEESNVSREENTSARRYIK